MTLTRSTTRHEAKRRHVGPVLTAAFLLATLAACGGDDSPSSGTADRDVPAAEAPAEEAPGDVASGNGGGAGGDGQVALSEVQLLSERKQILTADLVVQSDAVLADTRLAESAATAAGGLVTDERTETDPGGADGSAAYVVSTLTIRVPPEAVNDLLTRLAGLGTLVSQNRGATDVTDEYVDIEARLESQRASLDRLLALVTDAGDLQDVVALENEISRRQSDLDALAARLQALDEQVTLATVTLTLTSQAPERISAEVGFVAGLRSGWDAFTGAVVGGLTVLGAVLPFLVTLAIVGIPLYLLRSRRRLARAPVPVVPAPPA